MPKLRLDNALVNLGLASSRNKAQAIIMAGEALVNGQVETRADRNIYIIGSPRNTLLDECFNDGSLQPYPEENRQIEATPFFWGRDIPFLYRGKGFVWLSNDHIARYDPTRGGTQGDGEAAPFCREALLALLDELLTPAHGQEAAE